MKVELEDVLFWMDAIRNSNDRYRTLESFWKGQVRSKVWLIETLQPLINDSPQKISIHAGWNGVLASLLFNSGINTTYIESIDIDQECKETASTICKRQEMQGKFIAKTDDIIKYSTSTDINIVINTSCEHFSNKQLQTWYNNLPKHALIVLQSNDYAEIEDHINCVHSIDEFSSKFNLNLIHTDYLELPMYKRYMIAGYK